MKLESLRPPKGSHHRKKRVGRGRSSGHGKTSGRGMKGQSSRSGSRKTPGFQGGQMMLFRRLPKRGMSRGGKANMSTHTKLPYAVVNIQRLCAFEPGSTVSPMDLIQIGLVKCLRRPIKILGKGSLTRALHVKAHAFSQAASEAICQVGGTVEVLPLVMKRLKVNLTEQKSC